MGDNMKGTLGRNPRPPQVPMQGERTNGIELQMKGALNGPTRWRGVGGIRYWIRFFQPETGSARY